MKSPAAGQSNSNESRVLKRARSRLGTSALFRDEGVDVWSTAVTNNAVSRYDAESRPQFEKRKRAHDPLDAEYDLGKQKKVRRRQFSDLKRGSSKARNPFQEYTEKRMEKSAV